MEGVVRRRCVGNGVTERCAEVRCVGVSGVGRRSVGKWEEVEI